LNPHLHTMASVLPAGADVPSESTQQAVGYPALFLLIVLGALLPVVPTGALVSSAAVIALHQSAPVVSSAAVRAGPGCERAQGWG